MNISIKEKSVTCVLQNCDQIDTKLSKWVQRIYTSLINIIKTWLRCENPIFILIQLT